MHLHHGSADAWNRPNSQILYPLSIRCPLSPCISDLFIHFQYIYAWVLSTHNPPTPHTPHPITVIHHPSPASSAMQAAPKLPWQPLGLSSLQPLSYWKKSSGSSLRLSGGCGNWLGVSNHPPLEVHTHTQKPAHHSETQKIMLNIYKEATFLGKIVIMWQRVYLKKEARILRWYGLLDKWIYI